MLRAGTTPPESVAGTQTGSGASPAVLHPPPIMRHSLSLNARRELTKVTRTRYQKATDDQKSSLLDDFTAATGYHRKYAVTVLNTPTQTKKTVLPGKIPPPRRRLYDAPVEKTLVQVWQASNRLCSKRLVPFLPEFLETLMNCQEIST